MGQTDINDFRAGILEPGNARAPKGLDLVRHAVHAVLFGNADLQALDALTEGCLIIGNGHVHACGIFRVVTGHGAKHDGGVAH